MSTAVCGGGGGDGGFVRIADDPFVHQCGRLGIVRRVSLSVPWPDGPSAVALERPLFVHPNASREAFLQSVGALEKGSIRKEEE